MYSILQQIHLVCKDDERQPFSDIRREIAENVLQHPDINDLAYYSKVLDEMANAQSTRSTTVDSLAESSEYQVKDTEHDPDSPRNLDEQRLKNPFSSDQKRKVT